MDVLTIRTAKEEDIELLDHALRALSRDLDDTHVASADDLRRAGFGKDGAFVAVLATQKDAPVGAAIFTPIFSTTLGGPGAYVSDLWVSEHARGAGLGRRLLAGVAREARTRWGGGFIRLAVYSDNPRATAFYRRLGFALREGEIGLILSGDGFAGLGDQT